MSADIQPTRNNTRRYIIYLAITIGTILIHATIYVVVIVWFSAAYRDYEQRKFQALEYVFKTPNCPTTDSGCTIDITITNPTSTPLMPNYIDTGGGPLASIIYNIIIYDDSGKSCTGGSGQIAMHANTLQPGETWRTQLRCAGEKPPHTMGAATRVVIYGKSYDLD